MGSSPVNAGFLSGLTRINFPGDGCGFPTTGTGVVLSCLVYLYKRIPKPLVSSWWMLTLYPCAWMRWRFHSNFPGLKTVKDKKSSGEDLMRVWRARNVLSRQSVTFGPYFPCNFRNAFTTRLYKENLKAVTSSFKRLHIFTYGVIAWSLPGFLPPNCWPAPYKGETFLNPE